MQSHNSIKKQLQRFGLSEKQTDLYLLLIIHGEQRISQIVSTLTLPRSSVYELLRGLYKLGLAEEIIQGDHKKIRAYPLHAMRHDLDEKIQQLQGLADDITGIDRALARLPASQPLGDSFVRYYEGRSGARQLLWNTLKATDTVYVYSAWGRGKYVGTKFYQSFASESKQRKIKERVLINPSASTFASIKKYSGTPISRTSPQDIRMIDAVSIPIKGETFIYNNIFAQVYLKGDVITGFEIESKAFVDFQKAIYENLWNTAAPLPF